MATPRLQLPQADRLSLLVALLEAISRGVSGIATLSQALAVTPRQVHYYSHAASFLGLAEGEEGRFSLTPAGRRVLDADPDRRFETILGFALAQSALAELLLPLADEAEIDQRAIAKAIEGAGYGSATAERRAQTIVGWFRQAGLELSQSLRAGCPVRDQLSIFELPAPSRADDEEARAPFVAAPVSEPFPEALPASPEDPTPALPSPLSAAAPAWEVEAPPPSPLPESFRAPSVAEEDSGASTSPHEETPENALVSEEDSGAKASPPEEQPRTQAEPSRDESSSDDTAKRAPSVAEEDSGASTSPHEETPENAARTDENHASKPAQSEGLSPRAESSSFALTEPRPIPAPRAEPLTLRPEVSVQQARLPLAALGRKRPAVEPTESAPPEALSRPETAPREPAPGARTSEESPRFSETAPREPLAEVENRAESSPPEGSRGLSELLPASAEPRPLPQGRDYAPPRRLDDEDIFGLREERARRELAERPRGPVYVGVALRASLANGRATIVCRLVAGERPAASFVEASSTERIVDAIVRENPSVVAVAAPLWLPGEGLAKDLATLERADPELWVARPWTRSPFVAALGFARVELEGSAPGLAARGRHLREALSARGVVPRMNPATQEDPGPRLIEVHPGLTLAALANAAENVTENVPPGRRLRRAVENDAGPVEIPAEADTRHRDALAAAWTALKFARGAAWSPEGSSLDGGFVVVPFLG